MNRTTAPRVMYRWLDARGVPVAEVLQGVKMTLVGARAIYIAQVQGERVEKDTFTCARRVIDHWLRVNRTQATPVQG
jgi:hypothetical protein